MSGSPRHLTGSGMAFPWRVLGRAANGREPRRDLGCGIQLALRGTPAQVLPEVRISSELPVGDQESPISVSGAVGSTASSTPGRLCSPLFGKGIAERRLDLLALGLDLAVPPLALLVLMAVAMSAAGRLGGTDGPGVLFGVLVRARRRGLPFGGGRAHLGRSLGRQLMPLRQLGIVPLYLLWEDPADLGLARGKKQAVWSERTGRAIEGRVPGQSVPGRQPQLHPADRGPGGRGGGVEVVRFSIRRPPGNLVDPADTAEARVTRVLSARARSRCSGPGSPRSRRRRAGGSGPCGRR